MVEAKKMGGDCLNYGCVPSKALLKSAKLAHHIRHGEDYGLEAVEPNFSFRKVVARVHRAIATVEPHDSVERYSSLGVEVLAGYARILDPWTVEVRLNDGAGWPQLFRWIEKYLEYSVKTNHPNFVNRMWVGANLPSILGEMVAAASNTSSCTYESAPVSTLMEKYMIKEMLDLVDFKHGKGQMTTGSSNANMLAMMSARNEMLPRVKANGLLGETDIFGFVSADAHYSMEKAANILGLGTNRLIKIPVTNTGEMDTAVLAEKLKKTVEGGGKPFFVGGTAGTTVRGAYDSIKELLELRRQY